jgi:hypothetical protein
VSMPIDSARMALARSRRVLIRIFLGGSSGREGGS